MNTDVIRIRVVVDDPHAPHGAAPQQVWLNLSRTEFRAAFSPLPRDRELPWAFEERRREHEQRASRARAADIIAKKLAAAIVDAIGKVDTINGYSAQEWQQIHA